MLNAILSRKAPAIDLSQDQALSWGHLLRENEDLITATLMERLSYLPGKVAWSILVDTYVRQLPAFKLAELDDIELWPRWDYTMEGGRHVEPDALIRFTLGDPAQRWDVIFEAKRGAPQTAGQWRREQDAYLGQMEAEGETLPDRVVFMALGGLRGQRGAATARHVGQQVAESRQRRGRAAEIEILTVAADWSDMARALAQATPEDAHAQRIVADMIEALAIFGYRHLRLTDDLLKAEGFKDWQGSMDLLASRTNS